MSSDAAKKRLKQLCRDAGRSLGVAADHDRATAAATLKLMFEQLQVRLLDGERIDPGILLKLTDAIMQIAPPAPPKVRLEIVDSVGGEKAAPQVQKAVICDPGKENERSPGLNGGATPSSAGPESQNPAEDSRVVEIEVRKPPLWEATGYVPSQPFGDGAPTAPDHGREAWRPYARQGNGYGPDPSPWRIVVPAGHPLPTPGDSK